MLCKKNGPFKVPVQAFITPSICDFRPKRCAKSLFFGDIDAGEEHGELDFESSLVFSECAQM